MFYPSTVGCFIINFCNLFLVCFLLGYLIRMIWVAEFGGLIQFVYLICSVF
jgi:uncharacterized membrane protein